MKKIVFMLVLISISSRVLAKTAPGKQVIAKNELERRIVEYFQANIPAHIEKYNLEIKNLPAKITVPRGTVQFRIRNQNKKKFKGSVVIQLLVLVDQKILQKITTTVKISTFEKVVVAQRNFHRHEVIKPGDVKIVLRETTNLRREILHDLAQLTACRTKRFISQGSIITSDMIEALPLIYRGDMVTMVLQYNNVYITAPGKALQDGCKHDLVLIKNMITNKHLRGEVIDRKKVLIRPVL